jgi:hypothetical protein
VTTPVVRRMNYRSKFDPRGTQHSKRETSKFYFFSSSATSLFNQDVLNSLKKKNRNSFELAKNPNNSGRYKWKKSRIKVFYVITA